MIDECTCDYCGGDPPDDWEERSLRHFMEEALKIKDEGQYGNAVESLEGLKETRTLFKTEETQGTQFCKELDSVIRGMDDMITDY